jgi:hypothetical protein
MGHVPLVRSVGRRFLGAPPRRPDRLPCPGSYVRSRVARRPTARGPAAVTEGSPAPGASLPVHRTGKGGLRSAPFVVASIGEAVTKVTGGIGDPSRAGRQVNGILLSFFKSRRPGVPLFSFPRPPPLGRPPRDPEADRAAGSRPLARGERCSKAFSVRWIRLAAKTRHDEKERRFHENGKRLRAWVAPLRAGPDGDCQVGSGHVAQAEVLAALPALVTPPLVMATLGPSTRSAIDARARVRQGRARRRVAPPGYSTARRLRP